MFQWHGTYRQKDRIYHEDVYFGRGKAIDEATADEFEQVGERWRQEFSSNERSSNKHKFEFEKCIYSLTKPYLI